MQAQGGTAIAYASRTLNFAEMNFAITERECLTVIWALENFRPYFNQLLVKVIIDHKPLEHLMPGKNLSPRMIRWALRMIEFNIQIKHGPGATNTVLNFLSRVPRPEYETNPKAEIRCSLSTSWFIQYRQ